MDLPVSANADAAGKVASPSFAKRLSDTMWRRHRNPWSGWTRIALTPLWVAALWLHSWPLIALAVVLAATNPFWFPPPRGGDSWATRAVDGERIWLARATWQEKVLLMAMPGVMVVPLGWALWTHEPVWSVFLLAWSAAFKGVFCDWTARIAAEADYDRSVGPA